MSTQRACMGKFITALFIITQKLETLQVSIIALVTQLCPSLCDTMNSSPPDSSVHGIFSAKVLQWVAVSYSGGSSRPRDQTCVSRVSCIAGGFFTTAPPGKQDNKPTGLHPHSGLVPGSKEE